MYQQQQRRDSDALDNQHSTYLIWGQQNNMFFLNKHRTAVHKENVMLTGKGLRPVKVSNAHSPSWEKNQNTECQSDILRKHLLTQWLPND